MFTHLHVHSRYSFLDGLCSSGQLAETAAQRGFEAISISDHGNVSGWIDHQKACDQYGIKPIFGIEAYFTDDATIKEKGQATYHIVLLAKNENGVKSIFNLMTKAHDYFYYRPRFDMSMLLNTKDIVVLTACGYKGLITHPHANRVCGLLKDVFNSDVYIELMPLDLDFQHVVNRNALKISADLGINLIATNDVHYANDEDAEVHNFLLRMNTGGRYNDFSEGFYLRTQTEMFTAFVRNTPYLDTMVIQDALEITQEVVEKCSATVKSRDIVLPHMYDNPYAELERKAREALTITDRKYVERLDYELDIVKKKNFADYFLLIADICDHARNSGFEMPIGRGSSGGSLLCNVLGITQVDPLEHGLIMERFLNPERSDWPDIDLDFQDNRREEILAYLKKRFGEKSVSNISTYAELKPRSALKDVAKSPDFKITHAVIDEITKLLDNSMSIQENMDDDPAISGLIKTLPDWKRIVRYADAITGCYRQPGKHAAGIVVSPTPLQDISVLERRGNDRIINWGMGEAEYLGLVKADILGLRTLSVIDETQRIIGKRIDWNKLDLNDENLLKEFSEGNTIGIMQFESFLQRRILRDLSPIDNFSTIVDSNALGRPGPMDSGMAVRYTDRKSLIMIEEEPIYQKWVKDITKDTYGVIIYQEQIIEILQKIAGYTVPQADEMRRVIAKSKGYDEFMTHREEFVLGCKATSDMPEGTAIKLFKDLQKYSRYSFNKSHATAYSMTAARQMWLKVYYKLQYMTALLKYTSDKDKIRQFIKECHRLKIDILPVDVNASDSDFSIEGDCLRIGLRSIKGVGEASVSKILENRGGGYTSLLDFRIRNPKGVCNKAVLKSLILAGAFDSLGVNHKVAIDHIEWLNDRVELGDHVDEPDNMYDPEGDYISEDKEQHKLMLLEGIAKPRARLGMDIDSQRLNRLKDVILTCEACRLYEVYKIHVPFEHYGTSKVMVIGEAPGKDEIRDLHPFAGKAGSRLRMALRKCGLKKEDLFVTNVYKCRPLNNKLPKDMDDICYRYLKFEIAATNPKLIIALGNTPLKFFTNEPYGISKKSGDIESVYVDGNLYTVFYLIHPASIFRSTSNKKLFIEGINRLYSLLNEDSDDE